MQKNTITKLLLTATYNNMLEMQKKEVSSFAPINRVLDQVGFYSFDFVEIDFKKFILVFEEEETNTFKSKILVAKIHDTENKVIDISDDDYMQVLKIAHKYMNIERTIQ